MQRDLAISCEGLDCDGLLQEWRWILPKDARPLMVGMFGDWIFGAPDASHWNLSLLEGTFEKVASDSPEFNSKKVMDVYRDTWFQADWAGIALENGLSPREDECLGWSVHPIIGGEFSVANIQVWPHELYQSIMGQTFRQLSSAPT